MSVDGGGAGVGGNAGAAGHSGAPSGDGQPGGSGATTDAGLEADAPTDTQTDAAPDGDLEASKYPPGCTQLGGAPQCSDDETPYAGVPCEGVPGCRDGGMEQLYCCS